MKKILTIVGARPQFIKAAAVSRAVAMKANIEEVLIHTGQHFDSNMSEIFFKELDIRKPDYNLGIGGGTHGQNTGRMIEAIEGVIIQEKPDWVLVYGDTDSTLAGALAAVKLHVKLAHVEAGLRSFNRKMPEEVNRILTDHASNLLFAPTLKAVKNLEKEGIIKDAIHLVGDVMYDVKEFYKSRFRRPDSLKSETNLPFCLCTIHRAENTDDLKRLEKIVGLLNDLAQFYSIILPLHPRTSAAIKRLQKIEICDLIQVVSPLSYLEMMWALDHCEYVVTDSGGVQKEAYFFGKQCVTLRDETEWVELVETGWNRLVSLNEEVSVDDLLPRKSQITPESVSLYGDGDTATRLIEIISDY
jgi:UDP-GlcNAc3NAcA epimerase